MMVDPAIDVPFTAFYEQSFERLAASVRRSVGDDADDIAQEALLVARERWDEIRRLERPEAWVRRVALRMAARRARREGDRAWRERAAPPPATDEVPDLDVAAALLDLPDRYAAAIRLHHLQDRPIAEVADAIGCSEGAAKVLLHRARRVAAERLVGLTGRWRSERTWAPDAIVGHLTSIGAAAHIGPVLDEDLGGRGGRWELSIRDGAYVLLRDDGARFDHGSSRVDGQAFEMAPVLGTGRARYRAIVDGSRLSFRLLDSTTPPTRGVPDGVWISLYFESGPFVRADGPLGVP